MPTLKQIEAQHWGGSNKNKRQNERQQEATRLIEQYREAPLYQPTDEKDAARQAGYKRGLLAVRDGRYPDAEREMRTEYLACDGGAPFNVEELTTEGLEILTSMHVIYDDKLLPKINMTTGRFG